MTTNTTSEPSPGLVRAYMARPALIEACQLDYDGENLTDILDWIRAEGGTAHITDGECLRVNTFDGVDTALPGYWIVHHQGMRVIVQGRLTQSTYERDGQKRTSYDVQVDEVGPSLRYAKAQVERVQRPVQGGVDPWGTQTGGQQAHTLENTPTPSQPPTGWENTPQNGAQQAFPTNPPF